MAGATTNGHISSTLNTQISQTLAALRRPPDPATVPILPGGIETDTYNFRLVHSLQSLRSLVFHPLRANWTSVDPATYLSPFLDIIQSDDVTAASTATALRAVRKILILNVFDEHTPGAREAIHAVVAGITNCHLEMTDSAEEDCVLLRALQVLTAVVRCKASVMLSDVAVCTVVSTCFQIVQQTKGFSDVLHNVALEATYDVVEVVFSRLRDNVHLDEEKNGVQCMIDIFYFLTSIVDVEEKRESEVVDQNVSFGEEEQMFALLLINLVVEIGGDGVNSHYGIVGIIQDDLFRHLIHYGTRSGLPIFSLICDIVFNLYHFSRRYLRLQLEAFFMFVLLKIGGGSHGSQLQEVAIECIITFCRQPYFIMEMYVNYDCDPIRHNVFEEILKLLCKTAFPMSNPMSSMQFQAFNGIIGVIHHIADGIEKYQALSQDAYTIDDSKFKPFWLYQCNTHKDQDSWVEFVRLRKLKKKKIMAAANHYNMNEKKGMEFLKICGLVPTPPDAKSVAFFFRYTPKLDKNKIGDYLGEPDDFNIKVLKEFTKTFEFEGMILDTALRAFLETFRLPGESQKIQRILEAFSERLYEQQHQKNETFATKDVVFILCYSLIMLNTDQHNPQVKKKMTEDEFIRNNRAINGGKDLPREYLSKLFHSISTNAITLIDNSNIIISKLNSNHWTNLIKQSRANPPFILCDYKHKLCREVFITISGFTVATLFVIFEQSDDEDVLQECIEGLFSVARIARYGLEDILDALLSCFCKLTNLLNPYATSEEIVFSFTNEVKPKMATLVVFTLANKFGKSIRDAWRNLVDCLLKLKRLRLFEMQTEVETEETKRHHSTSESEFYTQGIDRRNVSGLIGRFTQLLSLETSVDSMVNVASEMENNIKLIQQCKIDTIFMDTPNLPEQSLHNLIRAIVSAAAGRGQKFITQTEEEETVGFCWDLIFIIIKSNIHRLTTFWTQFHDSLAHASQVPNFSPTPFAEKAIVALLRAAILILSESPTPHDKHSEELVFKSINLVWNLDKEIVDACNEIVAESTVKILSKHACNVQTLSTWKTLLHLLSVTGRHPENFELGVNTLITLMSEGQHINRNNYTYFIEAAFGFAALKISPVDKSSKMLHLMADSIEFIIQWQKTYSNDMHSNTSATNLFMKLVETLRKTTLVRREEIRNQAVAALGWCFLEAADELEWSSGSYAACFNLVIFAMVDDLHEKMVEYSRREGMEREMKSMEGTLKIALEEMVEVYLCFMERLAVGPGFRTFWRGLLRRMDTCMKARVGEEGMPTAVMADVVPRLLRRMIVEMKEKQVLTRGSESDLWEVTNIQIQWIAPSVKEELFPED